MTADRAPFAVHTLHADGEVVLAVTGEVDPSTSPELWAALDAAVHAERRLVLHLGRVTFFDASGLNVLLRVLDRVGRDGAGFVLRSPAPTVRRVLTVTGTAERFTIDDADRPDGVRQPPVRHRRTNHRLR